MKSFCKSCQEYTNHLLIDLIKFKILECDKCKFGLVDPIPSQDELTSLYNSQEYFEEHMNYDYNTLDNTEINKLENHYGNLFLQFLGDKLFKGAKLLEIGPGGGFGLLYFKNKGYNILGIEPSHSSVEFARDKLHLNIIHGDFSKIAIDEKFDFVILNHVLEHFTDCFEVIEKIKKHTNIGGYILIRVPNHDSYDRKINSINWPAYVPYHISYFSQTSLSNLFLDKRIIQITKKEYISNMFLKNIPNGIRKYIINLFNYIPFIVKKFNGRTITVLYQKIHD
jgi:2-polyprenyl-3-methyl-5-hydroxy-6-metoxy-1,4-benzoquinol methylase